MLKTLDIFQLNNPSFSQDSPRIKLLKQLKKHIKKQGFAGYFRLRKDDALGWFDPETLHTVNTQTINCLTLLE